MYAILVNEPGGDVGSYILGTAASSSESAMQLMSHRAEEFIDEANESAEGAEDYTIIRNDAELWVNVLNSSSAQILSLTAFAIDEIR